MNRKRFARTMGAVLLSLGACQAVTAADFYLCAGKTSLVMLDGSSVPMWGYALDDDNDLTNGCGNPVTVPGPELRIPPGDTVLNLHLRNDLPVPTSIVIPGLPASFTPVTFTDAKGRVRVRSFAQETAPGAIGTYTWNQLRPGTHVYHSGTHVAVQVQMGLYGPVIQDSGWQEAYPGHRYNNDMVLFYSEVDPALHKAVDSGSYGTPPGPTSTIGYQAQYFLINGRDLAVHDLPGAVAGQTSLIRMINMGLENHMPLIHDAHLRVIAEDGHPYPYPREQYSVMLAAGQTRDVEFKPTAGGNYAMFDRMLNLTNRRPIGLLAVNAAAAGLGDTQSSPGSLITLLHVDDDSDGDGVGDHRDNCTQAANPSQRDSDGDGYGNACDADLNNDGFTNGLDLPLLIQAFMRRDPAFDFNDDGYVNGIDIGYLGRLFFKSPGPSATRP